MASKEPHLRAHLCRRSPASGGVDTDDLMRRSGGLSDARRMRDAIVLVLALLGELDDITPDEPDRTAFAEIAGLFRDISDFAEFGMAAAKRAAG